MNSAKAVMLRHGCKQERYGKLPWKGIGVNELHDDFALMHLTLGICLPIFNYLMQKMGLLNFHRLHSFLVYLII